MVTIDWPRSEPRDGEPHAAVLASYAASVHALHAAGGTPVIVVHDGRVPGWAGEEFWRLLHAPDRFLRWVATVLDAIGEPGCTWVPVAEPNAIALDGFVTGRRPPHGRWATGHAIRAVDHLLAAHALAYAEIKGRDPTARVRLVLRPEDAYELGELFADVLAAPSRGVDRAGLHAHLEERRRAWYSSRPTSGLRERAMRRVARSIVPLELALPRTLAAVAACGDDQPFDER